MGQPPEKYVVVPLPPPWLYAWLCVHLPDPEAVVVAPDPEAVVVKAVVAETVVVAQVWRSSPLMESLKQAKMPKHSTTFMAAGWQV